MINQSSVPETTEYGTSATWLESPTNDQWIAGVEPEKTLPAPWWNFFTKLFTKTTVTAKSDLNNLVTELKNVLALNGSTANPALTNQIALTIADLLKAQSFAATVLTNPFTSGKTPRRIGDIAINTTSTEIWQGTATVGATSSWTRVIGSIYGGSVIADMNVPIESGVYTSYGTALHAPSTTESFFVLHLNSNTGTVSAWQMAVGYATGKIYNRSKITSVWGSWSVGITQNELIGKITPLSDSSRVMALNGDGIPMFPDNVAGRTYWKSGDWTTSDGWFAWSSSATLTIEDTKLRATGNGATSYIGLAHEGNALNKIHIVKCRDNPNVTQIGYYNGVGAIYSTPVRIGGYMFGMFYSIGSYTSLLSLFFNFGRTTTTSDIINLDTIYIGTGAYDTKVYGKDGQTVFDNVGVLPVPGPRGMALSFLGEQSLVGDNPIIGTSGTIAFWVKRRTIGNEQSVLQNFTGTTSGIYLRITAANILRWTIYNGTDQYGYGNTAFTDIISWHPVVVTFNASALIFNIDGVDVETIANPQVPAMATAVLTIGSSFNGEMSPIEYHADIWTLAQKQRFANGDDPIDSQQKSITGTPNALAVYGADGGLNAHSGATVWDSSNDGSGSGLDADLLDGYHAGNLSGQIPLSNGITNSNLVSASCSGNAATATLAATATNSLACSGNAATATNANNAYRYHGVSAGSAEVTTGSVYDAIVATGAIPNVGDRMLITGGLYNDSDSEMIPAIYAIRTNAFSITLVFRARAYLFEIGVASGEPRLCRMTVGW